MPGTIENEMKPEGELQESALTPEQKFIDVIEKNFHGSREIAQRLLEWGGNKVNFAKRDISLPGFSPCYHDEYSIDIPYQDTVAKTRLIFTPLEDKLLQVFAKLYNTEIGKRLYGQIKMQVLAPNSSGEDLVVYHGKSVHVKKADIIEKSGAIYFSGITHDALVIVGKGSGAFYI